MFYKEFYPTPAWLGQKMLSKIPFNKMNTKKLSILEPNAGKGDLLETIQNQMKSLVPQFRYSSSGDTWTPDIDTIEINPDLQNVLRGKHYRVIHNDFLSYSSFKKYDIILMNPPFSDGEKHLLKALEMQEKGGKICCLLNAQTLKNPCTNARKVLLQKLEEYQADIEYIPNAFQDAERKTDVEVALIYVDIPDKAPISNILEELKQEESNQMDEEELNSIIDDDPYKAIVARYNYEVKTGLKLIEEYRAFQANSLKCCNQYIYPLRMTTDSSYRSFSDNSWEPNGNDFIRATREKYWTEFFNNPQFTALLTTNLKEEYKNRVNELKDYDFSLFNIYSIRVEMSKSMVKGLEDTILNLFEELSHKYYWDKSFSKNIHYYNGWKTNSSYKINKKVILPLNGYRDAGFTWEKYDPTRHEVVEKLSDIEKVFDYLNGDPIAQPNDLKEALQDAGKLEQTKKIKLNYFDVTFYKKGTCHIEFTNQKLLDRFNIYGSQKKNWLPPSYGKTKYEDMTPEEQEVIQSFQGKKAYEDTLKNTEYMISINLPAISTSK